MLPEKAVAHLADRLAVRGFDQGGRVDHELSIGRRLEVDPPGSQVPGDAESEEEAEEERTPERRPGRGHAALSAEARKGTRGRSRRGGSAGTLPFSAAGVPGLERGGLSGGGHGAHLSATVAQLISSSVGSVAQRSAA